LGPIVIGQIIPFTEATALINLKVVLPLQLPLISKQWTIIDDAYQNEKDIYAALLTMNKAQAALIVNTRIEYVEKNKNVYFSCFYQNWFIPPKAQY
jgi:ABC-type uncharacterized transport system YnjBCD permease subunit